jgi:hypothetical protein
MVKVYVLQTDNRPTLDYLLLTQRVNKQFCKILGYEYVFLEIKNDEYGNIHPATKKVYIVNNFLLNTECDFLVFLDSDAWIQNGYWLNDIINNLIGNDGKQGCFSRDRYLRGHTFINSGSFIIKNNDFTKKMYSDIITELENNNCFHNNWPFDQYYISNYIFENKDKFTIFIPDILNTPIGEILRHNWWKNGKMYQDLATLHDNINNDLCIWKTHFIEDDYYDTNDFPNITNTAKTY